MNSANPVLHKVSARRLLPPARLVTTTTNAVQLAKANSIQKSGVVFDYVAILTSKTNYTFQADTTYYINGGYLLGGTVTFEGGTVIKYGPNGSLEILPNATVNCLTAPYRPAVFTSQNDNARGEPISGSSGTPNFMVVGNSFVVFDTTSITFHDLRFCYGVFGIIQNSDPGFISLRNCQFLNVAAPIFLGYDVSLYNVLIGCSADEASAISLYGLP